jgi:energy-converting hydrogenase B subunit D
VIPLQAVVIAFVAAGGTAVALTREPLRQAIVSGFYGLALIVLFVILQAPDVALSAIVVSSVGLPLLILLTLARIRTEDDAR